MWNHKVNISWIEHIVSFDRNIPFRTNQLYKTLGWFQSHFYEKETTLKDSTKWRLLIIVLIASCFLRRLRWAHWPSMSLGRDFEDVWVTLCPKIVGQRYILLAICKNVRTNENEENSNKDINFSIKFDNKNHLWRHILMNLIKTHWYYKVVL